MEKQIKIDIPEGKVPIMEQTESGIVITCKEKELTYDDIAHKILGKSEYVVGFTYNITNAYDTSTTPFYKKVEILRKLTNIRNYFGKPTNISNGWSICYVALSNKFYVDKEYCEGSFKVIFAKKEHAEQAIQMLGDELKYLFEPW